MQNIKKKIAHTKKPNGAIKWERKKVAKSKIAKTWTIYLKDPEISKSAKKC